MPATSRSGERLRRRSSSGRAGSPSKSRTTQPSAAEQRLAEVVVAVVADQPAADADVREQRQAVAHLLAAAGDRRERRRCPPAGRGRARSICSSIVAVSSAERLVARAPRARRRGPRRRRRARCASGRSRRRARAAARRTPRGRVPSSSSASSQPSRAVGDEALHDAERRVHAARPSRRTSRRARRCSGSRGSARKRSISSSGLSPASSAAEDLQHERVVEARSSVLDCSAPIARTSAPGRGRLELVAPAELDASRARPRTVGALGAAGRRAAAAACGSAKRVVDRDAADVVDDASSVQPSSAARMPSEQLVERRACRPGSAPRRAASASRGRPVVERDDVEHVDLRRRRAPSSRTSAARAATRPGAPRRARSGQRVAIGQAPCRRRGPP